MSPVRDLTPGGADGEPGETEIRDQHPEGAAWRADALAGSRHRRLADEIPPPLEDFDPEHAAALCAEVCREWLGDYAPGLALLPPGERRRVQALAAYARTLYDFARQRGLQGERLAQINRWEFALETALAEKPVGQPVFVAMAGCERERPWPRQALDEIAAAARRRAMLDERPRRQADDQQVARAVLGAASLGGDAARSYARVLRYIDLTTRAIERRAPVEKAEGDAQLGVWTRIGLLLRARFGAPR
jgi:hypothetical protein